MKIEGMNFKVLNIYTVITKDDKWYEVLSDGRIIDELGDIKEKLPKEDLKEFDELLKQTQNQDLIKCFLTSKGIWYEVVDSWILKEIKEDIGVWYKNRKEINNDNRAILEYNKLV